MTNERDANLSNLTSLWKHMGASQVPCEGPARTYACRQWPYRVWAEGAAEDRFGSCLPLPKRVVAEAQAQPNPVVPLWAGGAEALKSAGFRVGWQLTAMCAELPRTTEIIERVTLTETDYQAVGRWARLASDAFSYEVDASVIRRLLRLGLGLYTIRAEGQDVGTVLTHEEDGVVGIHMVGIVPPMRRRGLAREAMRTVMSQVPSPRARLLVLQAAERAEPLYASLGFASQFAIPHFIRP